MTKLEQIEIGQSYSWLHVVGEPTKRIKSYRVPCQCICGTVIQTDMYHLMGGRTRSCGCKGRGYPAWAMGRRGGILTTVGLEIYRWWSAMRKSKAAGSSASIGI
jgi:hypothetical protein